MVFVTAMTLKSHARDSSTWTVPQHECSAKLLLKIDVELLKSSLHLPTRHNNHSEVSREHSVSPN